MATNRVALVSSRREAPIDAQRIGPAPAGDYVEVTVMLRRRANATPPDNPSTPLSREEFAKQYGADPADIEQVQQFAESFHLRVIDARAGRRSVLLGGTVEEMTRAFHAELHLYRRGDQTFRARVGELSVPQSLHGIVEGVFGLDNRPQARYNLRRLPSIRPRAAGDVSYTSTQVAALYNFPQGADASGQTIAIIELGGGFTQSDLDTYFGKLGISPTPTVIAQGVDGGSNQPGNDPNGADGEVLLDIEVAGAIAPAATYVVYFAPNTDQGFLDAITTAIHDSTHNTTVVSISWGAAENQWTAQARQSFDQAFQDAHALGVTVCVASGDSGSSDGQKDGQAHVDFPAASPNVLGCGGTRLEAADDQRTAETVWNNGAGGGATGGGVSEFFPLPAYQASANVPVSVNNSRFAGRGVPDVSGDADPATGYQITVDGQNTVVGGTSAVAPLWAALIALLNQLTGAPLGFVNPRLYQIAAGNGGFFDITSGSNGAYSAGPGWDACTGLGSPDGQALLDALQTDSHS